jgi:hypothetical protein
MGKSSMKDYTDFKVQKEILLEYLQVMIALEDWHGVADLAMDLRELEAKQKGINNVNGHRLSIQTN